MEYGSYEDNNDDGASDSVVSAQERNELQGEDAFDAFDDRSIRSVQIDDVDEEEADEEAELADLLMQGMIIENEAEKEEEDNDDYAREAAIVEGEGLVHHSAPG